MQRNARRPTIGVLAGWQFYWTATPLSYLNPIFHGIRLAARELDCNLLLACGMGPSATSSDPMRPAWPTLDAGADADFVPVGPWNTDGLIAVNPLHSAARSQYLADVRAAGHPVVYIASGEPGPAIVADNAGGIHAAMQHLVEHGHRHIAFIAGSPDDLAGDSGLRLEAYQRALRTFHLPADPRLIACGQHVLSMGYAAMQQIMASGAHFTAVCASNDESALGAMQALAEAGRRVPEDVAVIGFDDRPEGAAYEPALSSVHVPLFLMGYRAVELLRSHLDGEPLPPQPVTIPTQLVLRESCGCGRRPARLRSADAPPISSMRPTIQSQVAERMAAAVLAETHQLGYEQVQKLCQSLVAGFEHDVTHPDQGVLRQTLDVLLREAAEDRDEIDLWQSAVSILAESLPQWLANWNAAGTRERAYALLDDARVAISSSSGRRHRRYVVDQRWIVDRIGLLTAELQTALDETQVHDILARHLPQMGISLAAMAEFSAEGDDAAAWSTLHVLVPSSLPAEQFRTRDFPPPGFAGREGAWSLALAPLVVAQQQWGYAAFDTSQLGLYGAIVQQVAAALNTAQLYRAATEGRRLAEEANRLKTRFLSTVSHELRTPLNLIVGLSSILLQEELESGGTLPAAIHADVERIHANAQHLGALINDVLDLASSEAGQLRLASELVDLGQVLRAVAKTGRHLARAKGLAWHEQMPQAGPWVLGDRTRLQQVALNLISNAVKFTAHGEIRLQLTLNGELATVDVCDTGIGIPRDEQQIIFDEFRRSERSVTRGYGGLGLGLAICKRLVELHGGTLGVTSSGQEGAGACFSFTLPVRAAPNTQPSLAVDRLDTTQRVLILAAGTGSDQRLATHLAQRGFAVEVLALQTAPGWMGQPGVAAASAIVLDVSRPAEYTWHALQAIKSKPETRHIPLLLFAGAADGGALLEMDVLSKPIELAELNQALDQHWLAGNVSGAQRTILVVDDDSETLSLHTRIVQAHSPSNLVLTANTGREALAILARMHVDLVLLDLVMPELDGFGVLEEMRAQEPLREIPVIVVTGQVLTEAEMARLNQGVTAVMGKGIYSMDETLAHLESALAHRRKLNSDAQRLVRKAMAYLHEHFSEPLTRQAIAQHVGLDEDYLTYCFRQELGITPITYLNRCRINQAKRLLKQSGASVTAIAFEVGFSDSGYFSRVFRREVGVSPDAFRRA